MRTAGRSVAPISFAATAVVAAAVALPALPQSGHATHGAALPTCAPQTLQVQLAGLVESVIDQAVATGAIPTGTDPVSVTRKAVPANATAAAVPPPPAYSPWYPFTTPTTQPGLWLTLPIAIPGLVFNSLAQSWTRDLTDKGLDPRLANQPELLSRYLLVPIAVTVQTTLTGLIGGGTFELGQFTIPQALTWAANNLRVAITNTIAAEKDLLSGGTGVLPDVTSAPADKPAALTAAAPAPAGTATTDQKVTKRAVAADTEPQAEEHAGNTSGSEVDQSPKAVPTSEKAAEKSESDGKPEVKPEAASEAKSDATSQSPTVKTTTDRGHRFRLGRISLPNPFPRKKPAAVSPASPAGHTPDSDGGAKPAGTDRGSAAGDTR